MGAFATIAVTNHEVVAVVAKRHGTESVLNLLATATDLGISPQSSSSECSGSKRGMWDLRVSFNPRINKSDQVLPSNGHPVILETIRPDDLHSDDLTSLQEYLKQLQ